jgi:hypothetical protein
MKIGLVGEGSGPIGVMLGVTSSLGVSMNNWKGVGVSAGIMLRGDGRIAKSRKPTQ